MEVPEAQAAIEDCKMKALSKSEYHKWVKLHQRLKETGKRFPKNIHPSWIGDFLEGRAVMVCIPNKKNCVFTLPTTPIGDLLRYMSEAKAARKKGSK